MKNKKRQIKVSTHGETRETRELRFYRQLVEMLDEKKKVILEILEGKKDRVKAVEMGEEIIKKVAQRASYQQLKN